MSLIELARIAGLYDRDAIAAAARAWLAGPGAPFLGLKRSEVAALRRAVMAVSTREEAAKAIISHIQALSKRRKGASRWDRVVAGECTLLDSLLINTLTSTTDAACSHTAELGPAWGRVVTHLNRSLNEEDKQVLDRERQSEASLEFLDDLIRLHQARQYWKEGEQPCQPSPAS